MAKDGKIYRHLQESELEGYWMLTQTYTLKTYFVTYVDHSVIERMPCISSDVTFWYSSQQEDRRIFKPQ